MRRSATRAVPRLPTDLRIERLSITHPDAELLIEAVQQEYVERYGGPDSTPMEASALDPPTGAFFVGYLGPRPPAGDPPHVYHVQVFALDMLLAMPFSGADRDQVLAAAAGHVLARGEITGTFARPATQVSRP
jgi:phosphatidylethanolamine-binding protein (PEBP) family uncharacterized protein